MTESSIGYNNPMERDAEIATEEIGGKHYLAVVGASGAPGADGTVDSATLSNVTASASSVTLAAANADRKGLLIYNDSSEVLRVKYGTGASATSFTVEIPADGYWEMPSPIYTGVVAGIWPVATGAARVTAV